MILSQRVALLRSIGNSIRGLRRPSTLTSDILFILSFYFVGRIHAHEAMKGTHAVSNGACGLGLLLYNRHFRIILDSTHAPGGLQ